MTSTFDTDLHVHDPIPKACLITFVCAHRICTLILACIQFAERLCREAPEYTECARSDEGMKFLENQLWLELALLEGCCRIEYRIEGTPHTSVCGAIAQERGKNGEVWRLNGHQIIP